MEKNNELFLYLCLTASFVELVEIFKKFFIHYKNNEGREISKEKETKERKKVASKRAQASHYRASGSSTWGLCSQTLSEGKVTPVSKPNPSASARVSNPSFPLGGREGVHCRFRLVTTSCPLCRSKLSLPELRGVDQKSLPMGMIPAQPAGGG